MNVQQIFDEVALLINHDITPSQQVNKLNQISRQLFREFPLPDKIYKFTMTNIPYYDVPADCAEDRVRVVIINGVEYPKLTPEIQHVSGAFCTIFLGKLYINPNVEGQDAYLYYGPRHMELIPSKLSDIPTFPEDYHEILVYGLAQWVASIERDIDLANNFQTEYDNIFKKAQKGLRKMGLKTVKITTIW
jgi:hypothetical protein